MPVARSCYDCGATSEPLYVCDDCEEDVCDGCIDQHDCRDDG